MHLYGTPCALHLHSTRLHRGRQAQRGQCARGRAVQMAAQDLGQIHLASASVENLHAAKGLQVLHMPVRMPDGTERIDMSLYAMAQTQTRR